MISAVHISLIGPIGSLKNSSIQCICFTPYFTGLTNRIWHIHFQFSISSYILVDIIETYDKTMELKEGFCHDDDKQEVEDLLREICKTSHQLKGNRVKMII